MNHPQLSELIEGEQRQCLQYLTNFFIEEFEDIKNGYKITMKFDANPFFENDCLVKEYHLGAIGDAKCIVTPIKWKPNKNFLAESEVKNGRKRKTISSFFSWFVDTKNTAIDDVADVSSFNQHNF